MDLPPDRGHIATEQRHADSEGLDVLPTADANNFMKAYAAFNMTNSESDVIKYAGVLLARPDVQAFAGRADSFAEGGLDADLVLCAVLTTATPAQLANFSGQGAAQEALVETLLKTPTLMRDMLVAGGAAQAASARGATAARYGNAMSIFSQITKASAVLSTSAGARAVSAPGQPWDDRSQASKAVLYRLAVGTAVEHAVPVNYRFKQTVTPPWGPSSDGSVTIIDPVARYMDFERAYLAGHLDPAFEVLTTVELRNVVSTDAVSQDLAWVRDTMLNYNPALIAAEGLDGWRYARAVRDDVSYGDPMCPTHPGLCDGHYTQVCFRRQLRQQVRVAPLRTWRSTSLGSRMFCRWTTRDVRWCKSVGANPVCSFPDPRSRQWTGCAGN